MAREKVPCPRCGEIAYRIKRRWTDRVVSLFKPVKRYQCSFCDWEDLIARAPKPTGKK